METVVARYNADTDEGDADYKPLSIEGCDTNYDPKTNTYPDLMIFYEKSLIWWYPLPHERSDLDLLLKTIVADA